MWNTHIYINYNLERPFLFFLFWRPFGGEKFVFIILNNVYTVSSKKKGTIRKILITNFVKIGLPSYYICLILWILCTICEKGNIKGSAVWILCNFNHKSCDFKTHKAQCGKIAYKTALKCYSEYMIRSINNY